MRLPLTSGNSPMPPVSATSPSTARRDSERSFAMSGAELRAGARSGRLNADARSDLDDLLSRTDQLKDNASKVVTAQASLLERYVAACDALRISLRLGDLAEVSAYRHPRPRYQHSTP